MAKCAESYRFYSTIYYTLFQSFVINKGFPNGVGREGGVAIKKVLYARGLRLHTKLYPFHRPTERLLLNFHLRNTLTEYLDGQTLGASARDILKAAFNA